MSLIICEKIIIIIIVFQWLSILKIEHAVRSINSITQHMGGRQDYRRKKEHSLFHVGTSNPSNFPINLRL